MSKFLIALSLVGGVSLSLVQTLNATCCGARADLEQAGSSFNALLHSESLADVADLANEN